MRVARSLTPILIALVGFAIQQPAQAWQADDITVDMGNQNISYAAGSWAEAVPYPESAYAESMTRLEQFGMIQNSSGFADVVFNRQYTKESGDGNYTVSVGSYVSADYSVWGSPGPISPGSGKAKGKAEAKPFPTDPNDIVLSIVKMTNEVWTGVSDSGSGSRTWSHILGASGTVGHRITVDTSATVTGSGFADANGYATAGFSTP